MTDVDHVAFPHPSIPRAERRTELASRRAASPMGRVRLPNGRDAVLLVKHEDIVAGLADPRLSPDVTTPDVTALVASGNEIGFGAVPLAAPEMLLEQGESEHLRVRRIVAPVFTPERVQRWVPAIRETAAQLVDDMERAGLPAELMSAYCFALPLRVICSLLGAPEEDFERFQTWSGAFLQGSKSTDQERETLIGEFTEYARDLLAKRRAEPAEDLIDELIAARDGEDVLSDDELLHMMLRLVAAGNETTSNALGRCVLTLLDGDRTLWRQLLQNRDLLPAAVDELLRCAASADGNRLLRRAVEDVDLPSGTVRKDETVVLLLESATSDESVYPDPDSVRFDRVEPQQVVFGGGAHHCLGADLAKAVLRAGLALLLERLPTLRLASNPDDIDGAVTGSLQELPVVW